MSRGKKLGRVVALGASAAATVATVSFATAGPAAAGTNGQMVGVSARFHNAVQVCGYNQNDAYSCTPLRRLRPRNHLDD